MAFKYLKDAQRTSNLSQQLLSKATYSSGLLKHLIVL